MHHVIRGPEPRNLSPIREQLTPRWVEFYDRQVGGRPGDTRWREFQPHLSSVFLHICGYCEEICKGDVDHFRPRSRFPRKVYRWSNWVLSCPVCNNRKGEQWPRGGFVDPCGRNCDSHFEFDTVTCDLIPSRLLTGVRRARAERTIEGLGLNAYHHLKKRRQWLDAVRMAMDALRGKKRAEFIEIVISRQREMSSITRQFLGELRVHPHRRQ